MQTFRIKKGATSIILPISIFDSSSTTGEKLAGLVFNSAGLTAYYNRSGAAGNAVAITLVTATKGAWVSSGFVAIDGTNMPGDYELHIPNNVLSTGADTVMIQLKGATNMVPKNIIVELVDEDLFGIHTVTIQFYRTATTTPIPDVLFDVYDATETARLNGTQLKSAVNGQMSFSRDNGTYKIRAMLAGFTFTTGTAVVADGNVTLIMYGAAITIPNPPVAGTQTLYGNVRELNWGVSTGDTVTAIIADKGQVVNGVLIQYLNLSTTVDANSQFSLTVPKGAVIRLTVKDHGTHEITINQENTYDVATYLTE